MAQRWIDALGGIRIDLFCSDANRAPWQVFPILLDDDQVATEFSARMLAAGMETRRYYKPSLGDCLGMAATGPCPNAGSLSARAVVLPVRAWMPEAEQAELIQKTTEILSELSGRR
jgi:dTDP-4-amino-4,6-dideoxygalactose transaminase